MKALKDMSEKELNTLKAKFTQEIGLRVRAEREKKKLSQEQLADLAGFYRTYIGHIETGSYSPSSFTLARLAKALNIDPGKLIKGL